MKVTREELLKIIGEESAAAKAAKKAGLVHLGFGRYGPKKGDKVVENQQINHMVEIQEKTQIFKENHLKVQENPKMKKNQNNQHMIKWELKLVN